MKARSVAAGIVAALAIVLVLPVEAQRVGGRGTGVHAGGGGGRGAVGLRMAAPAPRSGMPVRLGGTGRFTRPVPPVVLARPVFLPHRPTIPVQRGLSGPTAAASSRPLPLMEAVPPRPAMFEFHRAHRFHRRLSFPFCSSFFGVSFAMHHFKFFGRSFNCLDGPFFQPFFFPFVRQSVVIAPFPIAGAQPYLDATSGEMDTTAGNSEVYSSEYVPPPPQPVPAAKPAQPITLLQLKDGSMYGLTDYWLENGQLHYITSYGGENVVPLERVDLDATVRLNWERRTPFTLRPKPPSR